MKSVIPWPARLAVFLALAGSLPAQTLITISDYSGTITSINTSTLTTTTVGTVSGIANNATFDFGDLALDTANNQIYMITGFGDNNLYTLNPSNGVATLVGTHGINDLFAMTYDSANNTLYAATFYSSFDLYTLNPNTGAATLVGATSVGLGSMAFDTQTGQLVGVNDGTGALYQVNTTTGALTLLASPGYTNNSGLVYDPTRNIFWDADASGNLYEYDPNNNFAQTIVLSGLGENDGLVFVSVPEPPAASLLACALALVGLAKLGRRGALRRPAEGSRA